MYMTRWKCEHTQTVMGERIFKKTQVISLHDIMLVLSKFVQKHFLRSLCFLLVISTRNERQTQHEGQLRNQSKHRSVIQMRILLREGYMNTWLWKWDVEPCPICIYSLHVTSINYILTSVNFMLILYLLSVPVLCLFIPIRYTLCTSHFKLIYNV